METLAKKVNDFYAAIACLPDRSGLFSDPNLKVKWIEMLGGPYGGVFNNLEETLAGVFARVGGEWKNFKFTPSGFHDTGEAVTVEGTYTGENKKTGKTVTARVIHLWKLSGDELLVEQFTDTALFWRALE